MYNTSGDKLPKPPVIPSYTSAEKHLEAWVSENRYNKVKDADGMEWDVKLDSHVEPSPKNPKKSLWTLKITVTSKASGWDLVDGGVLDKSSDARLIEMLGDDCVPLSMKPLVYEAASEEEIRTILANALPRLKTNFSRSSLGEVKRSLVGRWIDSKAKFGANPEFHKP